MRIRLLLLVSILGVCGCAHHYQLGSMSKPESRYFEKRGMSSVFSVQMVDGRILQGNNLNVSADSLTWDNLDSEERLAVPQHQVRSILFHSRLAGGIEGFMYGFFIGAAIGGALGYSAGDDCSGSGELCFNKPATALILGVATGGVTSLIGTLIGSVQGTDDYYYPAIRDILPSVEPSSTPR